MYTVATDLDQILSWAIFEFVLNSFRKKKKKKNDCAPFFIPVFFRGTFMSLL